MTREERKAMFEKSKQLRKQQKEQEAKGSDFGSSGFTNVDYTAWVKGANQFKTLRFLGNPMEYRMDDPYSPTIVRENKIIGDDGKRFQCIHPSFAQNPNFVITRVLKEIMDYDWDDVSKTKKYKKAQSHPDIIKRITNGDNAIDKGWFPTTYVVWNVIDREQMEWHRENKKTMLLSKKASPLKDKPNEYFYDIGVPAMIYDEVYDRIVNWAGDWEDYDVIVRKLSSDPWYICYHPSREQEFIEDYPEYANIKNYSSVPLTEEEMGWERFNFDKLFKPTSASKLKKHLGLFLRELDTEFGKNYCEQLDKEIELEAKESSKAESNETYSAPATEAPKQENTERQQRPRPVREEKPSSGVNVVKTPEQAVVDKDWTFFKAEPYNFEGMSMLTPENLADIVGWDESKQEFKYDPSAGDIYDCPECGFGVPGSFQYCPKCRTDQEG